MNKEQKNLSKFWLTVFIFNTIIMIISQIIAQDYLIFGNANLMVFPAMVLTSLLLIVYLVLSNLIMNLAGLKLKNPLLLSVYYGIFNISGLWLIARAANFTGFGIKNFLVAIILGLILNSGQYYIWMQFAKTKK
jgi:hypothetical protein